MKGESAHGAQVGPAAWESAVPRAFHGVRMKNGSNGSIEPQALRRLLSPRSVAVVGASATPGALGAAVLENLDRAGFAGNVYLVNPNRERIGDRPCLKSAEALPAGVDAAVLAVPRAAVLQTLAALARREVGAAIIFSAGFAEGGEEGAREQREIARIAHDSGMVVEGPNCLGLVNFVDRVALTFVNPPRVPESGGATGVGIVSQSGAMAAVLGTMLAGRALGLTYSISTGNEAASGVEDYLAYLLEDARTRVVGLIVEQFRHPGRFLDLARRARAAGKVIVLLHPGRSSAARESAATHTGALAGDFEVMRTLVERRGVLLAGGLEEFGDLLEIAARCPAMPAGGAAVMTESGAFKALTLDLCEQVGLPLPAVDDRSAPALRAALPPFVPVSNPIDLTAQALVDPDLYRRTLAALAGDERFGSIVACIIQADAAERKFSAILGALQQIKPGKPVLFAGLDEGAGVPAEYAARLRALGVPYFPTPERALRALARFTAWSGRTAAASAAAPLQMGAPVPAGVVPEYRAKQLLAPLGVSFPAGRFVATLEQAVEAAGAIGYPVALKAQSAALSHKSDAGGVVLHLRDPEQLAGGWERMHAQVARHCAGLKLDGVLVERMAPPGVELIIGGRNDPQWGPVLLIGFGGVQAEVLHDVRLLPADLEAAEIAREIGQLKCGALLKGFRGAPPADVEAAAELAQRVARILQGEPRVREIDLNPVMVHPKGQGATALDALMIMGE